VSLARTYSVALIGVTGQVVEVEADIANGLVGMILVGLPDTALREARDRIRAAIVNSGEKWPQRKITVGLSPASLPKRGSWFDLAIAVGLLYVLIWEALLSNFVSGARLLSVGHYGLGIANGIAHDTTLGAGLNVATSVIMGAIVTVAALALAIRLLSSFTLKGEPA